MGEFEKYRATLSDYELLRSANCCRHAFEHQQSKIEQLEKEKAEITRLVQSLRNEFDLNSDCPQVDRQIELLEESLRGAND